MTDDHEDDNDNDFELIHLDEGEVQEVIDWAVATAALIIIMHSVPTPEEADAEAVEQALQAFHDGTNQIWDNLPDVLVYPSKALAYKTVEDARREEEEVKRFREQLDGLDES